MNSDANEKWINTVVGILTVGVIVLTGIFFKFINHTKNGVHEINVRQTMINFITACEIYKQKYYRYPTNIYDLKSEYPSLYDVEVKKVSKGHWSTMIDGYIIDYYIFNDGDLIRVVAMGVGAKAGPRAIGLTTGSDFSVVGKGDQ